jgi:hypothetical protein
MLYDDLSARCQGDRRFRPHAAACPRRPFNAAGTVAQLEGTIFNTVVNSTKLGLIIDAQSGTGFVIDNLTIEGVK